jgi:uncharacterized protein
MTALTVFFSSLLESLPFLLLGTIVSSFLLMFVDSLPYLQLIRRWGHNPLLGAVVGSCLGLLLPVGQYGSLPVMRRLLSLDVPPSSAIAFLIAAPTINPIVIYASVVTFTEKPEIIWLRIFLTLAIAILIGYFFGFHKQKKSLFSKETEDGIINFPTTSTLIQSGTLIFAENKLKTFSKLLENAIKEFLELGTFLVFGCAAAAIVQTVIPQVEILSIAQTPITRILAFILLATVLSLGSIANTFFISSLAANLTNGSVLAFCLFGSVIDLKSLSLLVSTLSAKTIAYLLILMFQLTFLLTLVLDFYIN